MTKPLSNRLSKLLPWLAGIVLFFQLLTTSQVIGSIASKYGVAFGLDRSYASMDVAQALRTVQKSNWWQHNGYHQYGPLYFRMGWTLDKLDPRLSRGSDWKWGEDREKHYHEALLTVNLLAFAGLLFTISCMLTPHWAERLIGTSVLWTVFHFSDIWCWSILVAKPEMFIAMLSTIGSLWAWKMFVASGTAWRPLLITAAFFGLAMATKLSTLVYLAILPLCFLPLFDRHASGIAKWPILARIVPGICFLLIVFAIYVGAGWPQNSDFARLNPYMKFMHTQNSAPIGTMPPMEWGRRIQEQIIPPVLGVVFLSLIWREAVRERRSWWTLVRALGFAIFPIYYLCGKNIASPSEHYMVQYIPGGLVMLAGCLGFLWPRKETPTAPGLSRNLINIGLLVLCLAVPRATAHRWGGFTADMLESRELAQTRYDLVRSIQEEGEKVYVDPYVSFEPSVGQVFWTYRAHEGLFQEDGPRTMVLLPDYYNRYLEAPPNFYVQFFHRHSWRDSQTFYRLFENKDETVDTLDRRWTRDEQLGLHIWRQK